MSLTVALLVQAGITLFTYPTAASWVSQYNQSNVTYDQTQANSAKARAEIERMLDDARHYNDLLESGALFAGGSNVAAGTGASTAELDYGSLLNPSPTGMLARLRIPTINVDLPVYHGTSDKTLLKGVGHLEGTSLPVGGEGKRTVLTGHRGLATATMFTDLDKVSNGDTFSIEVLGEVFTYRVFEIKVVEPDATEEIRAVPGRDLATLVTCTPLGVNTQRILITGERVDPTPQGDLDAAGSRPSVPGFPWWIVLYAAATVALWVWFWRSGYAPVARTGGPRSGAARPRRRRRRHRLGGDDVRAADALDAALAVDHDDVVVRAQQFAEGVGRLAVGQQVSHDDAVPGRGQSHHAPGE
ncbi:class C sortase [Microbacterium sp. NE2TL11]|nr:class C sortase [Microbacterium thalli]MDD7929830.1 class C sortase [Microbacterium thalli]